MIRDYSYHQCKNCFNPAVGVFYRADPDSDKLIADARYCDKHFRARSYVQDSQLEEQYYNQWGHQDWFRIAMPTIIRKYEKKHQLNLFN